MSFLNFIKKKELGIISAQNETIAIQNSRIERLEKAFSVQEDRIVAQNNSIHILEEEKKSLQEQVRELSIYQSIVDVDKEIDRKIADADKDIAARFADIQIQESKSRQLLQEHKQQIDALQLKYMQGLDVYEKLKKETEIYRESLEMAEYGIYEPHFDYDTSEEYKYEIIKIRELQKQEIRNETAVEGGWGVSWNNSFAKGHVFIKKEKKLMLRAFNGECDSFIGDVDWNNISKMEIRIQKSYDSINKTHRLHSNIYISERYKDLKIKELRLVYEYKLKCREEKEEQRAIREQMREEEKARREIEAAMIKAQKEEERYEKALNKARKELGNTTGIELDKLRAKITELEAKLTEAGFNKERAQSMAQQTKRGHVYVISNIGSFGDNVYKIGMTRRIDPMDRVRELGDASVPFPFDVHAIIFCEDAPTLEYTLHKAFDNRRVNMINRRKEFFNVSLDEIESVVRKVDKNIEFVKIKEAKDYRQSIILQNKHDVSNDKRDYDFPSTLFVS